MPDLRPVPAWSLDGPPAEPEPPPQAVDGLTLLFGLLSVAGMRFAQAAHQGQRLASRVLAR